MDSFIAWATDTRTNDKGLRVEHVTFPSFVKTFALSDLSGALNDYSKVLASSELNVKRRGALQAAHKVFLKNRLNAFWTSWMHGLSLKSAQQELATSSAVTAKKTAVLAQEASLHESAVSYRALKQGNAPTNALSTTPRESSAGDIPTDTTVTDSEEQLLDTNKQLNETDTDTNTDGKWGYYHVQGQTVLPPPASSDLSGVLREIYIAVLSELSKPGPVIDKKDVLVLLSSIINTVATSGRIFSISKKIVQGSRLPLLDTNSAEYQDIKLLLDDLLTTLYPAISNSSSTNNRRKPYFQSLKRRVWALLSQLEEESIKYTTLQIVTQILLWIELDIFASPTSEHVFVSSWSTLFNILLHDTPLRAVPGELISKASAKARQEAKSKYGSTCSTPCGRKVDMSIRIRFDGKWQHEVAIFEFKREMATRSVRERQQKKSVRLNAAILYDLEAKGLDIEKSYPIIAEGLGLGLDFYTLRRYNDVLGAGRSTVKGISIPPSVDQLKAFFESETMFILLAFKEHLRQYAYDVIDVLANTAPTPFGYDCAFDNDGEDDEQYEPPPDPPSRSSTPPPRKRPNSFVLFSPSKKDKIRTYDEVVGDWTNGDDEDDDYDNSGAGY
ncbi:hypothetical protein BGW38_004295 [Lunasporangiospora selenospora]|uniref:Uncharacterized protein n=1 Tax=Lunasporangiospora selenospora TaxID=979761 RepID=A0A9P6FQC3_9FUNG|nr:hypothetical protein BGW38_004295 [Lunasporangiospora selenospora]